MTEAKPEKKVINTKEGTIRFLTYDDGTTGFSADIKAFNDFEFLGICRLMQLHVERKYMFNLSPDKPSETLTQ